jgi:hypothetical protein
MAARRRPKPFKAKVTSFDDVSTNMGHLNRHLKKIRKFLDRKDWTKIPNRKKKKNDNGNGGQEGGSRPPNWPP